MMARVIVKVWGHVNAQALFDVFAGERVRWSEPPRGLRHPHILTFDYALAVPARSYIRELFPRMRFTVCEVKP